MSVYLFDTNALSEMMRWPQGALAKRAAALSEEDRCTSIIVACELRYGALKRRSTKIDFQLATVLEGFRIEPFSEPAELEFARIRTELEAVGQPIGAFDMLIAAHTIALDCTLITDNTREFARVPGLKVENWLRA